MKVTSLSPSWLAMVDGRRTSEVLRFDLLQAFERVEPEGASLGSSFGAAQDLYCVSYLKACGRSLGSLRHW